MNMNFNLSEKKILITGASSGIGKQTAIAISEYGGNVFITAREQKRLNETFKQLKGNNHQSFTADLTDEKQIHNLIENLPELNGVVYCAGITCHIPAKFIRSQDISQIFKINYEAPVLLSGKLLSKKRLKNNSSIVFLSSIATKHPYFGGALYGSTKSAIEAYSKVLALELAPKGIRSNCISPTFVKTPMVDDTEKTISKETLQKIEKMHPLGFGEPSDVANAIVFFLSDASRWITGANLILGGG